MAGYSEKAQPFLDAIAEAVFTSLDVREWLIQGTPAATLYKAASVLKDEQRAVRWRKRPTKQPFWANYYCGKDAACSCRPDGSKALESDAIFLLRNEVCRVLAIHVEFKHPRESFKLGQPEAYPMRAACFAATWNSRETMSPHDDWATVLFCGEETLSDERVKHFQRVITHQEARSWIAGYPK